MLVAGGRVATVAMPCPHIQPQGGLRQTTVIKPSNSHTDDRKVPEGLGWKKRSVGERGRQEEVMG